MAAHDTQHHEPHDTRVYWYVFFALFVLTGASFFTYSEYWPFHDTPAVGWAFMMAVSVTKATLVMLFFMHLKYEANWKYVLTIPATVMALFLIVALVPDVMWRYEPGAGGSIPSVERIRFAPRPDEAELLHPPSPHGQRQPAHH